MLKPSRRGGATLSLALTLLLAGALVAHGQPAAKMYRIGFLGSTSQQSHGAFVDAFREGLRERGYIEGKNLFIEYRWAESDYTRLPALAAELVQLKVDLILTHGSPGGHAAKEATTAIPIVVAITGDAVATGLVQSLARPGGNLTGSTFFFAEVNAKRLELLKEALPSLRRVAVLMNDDNRGNVVTFEAMTKTARSVNLEVVQVSTRSPEDFERAFSQIKRSGADAVSVYEDALFVAQAARLAALAERQRLPSIGFREYADRGGLLGFGVDLPDVWRRAAGFVDRIFKGAKPSEMPMQQPEKYDTVVNLRTAKVLHLTVPRRVLLRADKVID
jgi:putative ABC transport system substrate-binding protein